MTDVTIDCPICKLPDSIQFHQGVENGAPHGAGYWPIAVSDSFQDCTCELTHDQWVAAEYAAWATLEPAEYPGICHLCGHWQVEHTPDCEACWLNDASLASHTFNQAP